MSRHITLYSFGNRDRSGKVRWTANELGYTIEEHRLELGEHMGEDYLALNPYQQIPTVEMDGALLIESTAVCINLAEKHPEYGLIPDPGDPLRVEFWQQMGVATQTFEYPVVNYILSKAGIVDGDWAVLLEGRLRARFAVFVKRVPVQGWWLGEAFTLADIFAAYVLRIAVKSDLLEYSGPLKDWFERLMARPAVQKAGFFDGFFDDP